MSGSVRSVSVKRETVSQAVINRLPRYYRRLAELDASGVKRVSSKELSDALGCTASQIRQDFNNFGKFGQQGAGYVVSLLLKQIRIILGLTNAYNVVVVGAGNLGRSLANHTEFEGMGFNVMALFDTETGVDKQQRTNAPVLDVSELDLFLKHNKVDIAIIAVPPEQARGVAKTLADGGVGGFWNFTEVDLSGVGDGVRVENVHLSDSLMMLTYRLSNG